LQFNILASTQSLLKDSKTCGIKTRVSYWDNISRNSTGSFDDIRSKSILLFLQYWTAGCVPFVGLGEFTTATFFVFLLP